MAPKDDTDSSEEASDERKKATEATEATTGTSEATTTKPEVTTPMPKATTVKPEETTTAAPEATTTQPEVSTAKPEVTTTKPGETTTIKPSIDVSSINKKNYTFIEHTSFNHSMHMWDFEGLWNKYNLRDMKKPPIPFPRPNAPKQRTFRQVEGGGTPGGAMGTGGTGGGREPTEATKPSKPSKGTGVAPDNNNFVLMNYVSRVGGVISKSFDTLVSGEVIIEYYMLLDEITLTVTLVNANGTRHQLLSTSEPEDRWYAVSLPFTEEQTKCQKFKLELRVLKKLPPGTGKVEPKRAFALHHLVVGGFKDPRAITPVPTPSPQSNSTIFPPGSLTEIENLASSIWTALYVFLAFFLVIIIALVAVVAKGRLR